MAKVTNTNIPTDLQEAFRGLIGLHDIVSSEQDRAQILPSVRSAWMAATQPGELQQMAIDAATWLTTAWHGNSDKATQSVFYAARLNEIATKSLNTPYWRELAVEWDKTGICTPRVEPFGGTINPAYNDPLRQPTDCRYPHYDRLYNTPTFPSMGTDKSPGWTGAIDAGYFKDTWHATRIIAFTIPTAQRSNTQRPIILHVSSEIECAATIRGNAIWFTISTKSQIANSGWTPGLSDRPITHYKPSWRFSDTLPGDSLGGWIHDETVEVWRYGSWKTLDSQPHSGQIIVIEIGTPPSLGRYYSRNDSITVLHNDTAAVWWPQAPEEM